MFLKQGDREQNVVSYPGKALELQNPKLYCPHNIALPLEPMKRPKVKLDWNDPLLKFMMPNTERDFAMIEDTDDMRSMVLTLDTMYGGSNCEVYAPWMLRQTHINRKVGYTNLQPIVIYGCNNEQINLYRMLSQMSGFAARRILIVRHPGTVTPPIQRIETELTQSKLDQIKDWPAIAGHATRQLMLEEKLWT